MANRPLLPTALLASFLLLSGAGVATCTFPEVTLGAGGSTGGAAGSQTTSTTGGSGGVGGATTTTGTGGVGGTTSATGGAGASGGTGGVGGTGGETTTSTMSGDCPVDNDGDQATSWKCAGGADCADDDVNANPGITEYSSIPIQNEAAPNTAPYDKNCDGTVEKETKALGCAFLHCPGGKGFQNDVACGASAPLGHCGGVPCGFQNENPSQSKIQRCR